MDSDSEFLKKYLKRKSSRHHYIPKFLSSAFANAAGMLYIYDKMKDEILKNPRPPKSIFFENDRNTLFLDEDTKTSILEDFLYKGIDDKTSRIIKEYQTKKIKRIDFNVEDNGTILFFLISLFWRLPKTDFAASNLIDRAEIEIKTGNPEVLRNDPVFRKISRAGLFKHHVAEIKKYGLNGKKWINLHENENPLYVIGDYPILFKKEPSLFSEFNDSDILLAVSSNRIYSSTNENLSHFETRNSFRYNACVIEQSVRFIAGGDLDALKASVLFWKKLKEIGLIYGLEKEVFMT